MSTFIAVALLVFLAIPGGISLGGGGVILRCQCIAMEKKPIGRYIATIKLNPANSHCSNMEIIATLKGSGEKICLDPDARWVKKVLGHKLHSLTP